VVGAGAAGLMTARELARAGKRVTILEARDRCGGRIYPLPAAEFGYPAEGGAEFVHGVAPVTRSLMREAGLSLSPRGGTRWSVRTGALSPADPSLPDTTRFYQALREVKADLPIAEFLETHFADRRYDELRRSITRTVEGYDAADPRRASTLALRDEWMAQGYGKLGLARSSAWRRDGDQRLQPRTLSIPQIGRIAVALPPEYPKVLLRPHCCSPSRRSRHRGPPRCARRNRLLGQALSAAP